MMSLPNFGASALEAEEYCTGQNVFNRNTLTHSSRFRLLVYLPHLGEYAVAA